MIEKCGQGAHQQDERQRLEGENERVAGLCDVERRRAAPDIAEHQRSTGESRLLQRMHHIIECQENMPDRRQGQQQNCHRDMKPDPRQNRAPGDIAPPFADRPGEQQDKHIAQDCLHGRLPV